MTGKKLSKTTLSSFQGFFLLEPGNVARLYQCPKTRTIRVLSILIDNIDEPPFHRLSLALSIPCVSFRQLPNIHSPPRW